MSNISSLEEKLGYKFKNINLLEIALTHKSYSNEQIHKKLKNNERFEFLGDAVLDLITTEYLFHRYPNYDEGILTKIQAQIISSKGLFKISQKLNLGKYIKLSRGESSLGGREKISILADTVETIIGAIYIDSDFYITKDIVIKLLSDVLNNFDNLSKLRDYKTELQELVQNKYARLPQYIIEDTYGPDHHKIFSISVYVNNKKMGLGFATNKKDAEKIAAKQAYLKMIKEEK